MKLDFVVTKIFVKFTNVGKKITLKIWLVDQFEKSLNVAHSKKI